jgi:hypothetical protein
MPMQLSLGKHMPMQLGLGKHMPMQLGLGKHMPSAEPCMNACMHTLVGVHIKAREANEAKHAHGT